MKTRTDVNTDLSTLPELIRERNDLLPKIEDNTATVREARRFVALHSLISMFNNAKVACRQIKRDGNSNNKASQDLIESERKSRGAPI